MTDPTGGAPNPEVPVPAEPVGAMPIEPVAAPPPAMPVAPPAAAAPPPAGGNWQTPPPPAQPAEPAQPMQVPQQFQPVAAAAGPAPGVAYADLMTRLFAFVIDAVLLWIVMVFVGIALGALLFGFLLGGGFFLALIAAVLLSVASLAVSAAYFVWGWTNPSMRASLGQRALGLNTVNALDGATLTREQAVRRWFFLYGLLAVASVLQTTLGASDISFLGPLIGLMSLAYVIFLIWTTSKDAKRQGFHDIKASTVVVKRIA